MTDRKVLAAISVLLLSVAAATLWVAPVRPSPPSLSEIASGIEREEDHLTPWELDSLLVTNSPVRLIDLRDSLSFSRGHVPGAVRVSLSELLTIAIAADRTTVLYSEGGIHAAQAWALLRAAGHERIFTLLGGWKAWSDRHPRTVAPTPPRASPPSNDSRERERLLGEC